ncbi:hypothetical protein [Escherichia coli]|uniref:hypothetical protein n=1 Tax=Escherichia coli TaxID=562 RepID=UPI00159BCAB7|nr:hypothetical protein [Escherichia coli]
MTLDQLLEIHDRAGLSTYEQETIISFIGELHATTRNAAVTAATTGKMRMGFSLLYFC